MRNKLNLMYDVCNEVEDKIICAIKCEIWDKVSNKDSNKVSNEIWDKVSNEVWYIVRDGITKEMELFNEN